MAQTLTVEIGHESPCRRAGMPSPVANGVRNVLTVDLEEYFQVSAFERRIARSEWTRLESRVRPSTERLLELFSAAGVSATFFVLGWIAERYPELVRQIARAGHEIASHGHEHRLVYEMTAETFRNDLRRARSAIERAGAGPVVGYRAPSYSITRASLWALDILVEEGYVFDASIYPIHHDRYGIPGWPRHIHRVRRAAGAIWELPGSTVRRCGVDLPIGGGGYFRLLPYRWTRSGIRNVNERERQPAVFYIHPWEIDPEQPTVATSALSRLRHYRNLHKTEERLRRLLQEFRFGSVAQVLDEMSSDLAQAAMERQDGAPLTPSHVGQRAW